MIGQLVEDPADAEFLLSCPASQEFFSHGVYFPAGMILDGMVLSMYEVRQLGIQVSYSS